MSTLFSMTFTLFLCVSAAASELFMLPDEVSDALHRIKQEISSAEASVIVMTPKLQSRSLSAGIVKLLDKKVAITIITAPDAPGESAGLSQYSGVTVLTHRGIRSEGYEGTLGFSAVLVDSRRLCTGALALDEVAMRHDVATFECTGDTRRIGAYKEYITTITARSHPYLQ